MRARTAARTVLLGPARLGRRGYVTWRTATWPSATRLFVVGDTGGWSVDEDAVLVTRIARELGYEVAPAGWALDARRQAVFLPSHFTALRPRWLGSSHRLGLAYLHGRPGTAGHPEFDLAYDTLRAEPERFERVQVTHAEMHDLVLSAGVDPARVFRIPIGIELGRFPLSSPAAREQARRDLDLPVSAFVVGSFQKDGVGWDEGLEPKSIKGPDVLVATLKEVHARIPELVVLLTGPARGYVRRELEQLAIPYRHILAHSSAELARAYNSLDVYLVASRQEGGPKGPLEAHATGIPVVATRVGATQEMIEDGRNGLLVDVEDVDALAESVIRLHDDGALGAGLRDAGRATAEALVARIVAGWTDLLDGFVELSE